jgi:hypothetical protein
MVKEMNKGMNKKTIYLSLICTICVIASIFFINNVTGSQNRPTQKNKTFNNSSAENELSIISMINHPHQNYDAILTDLDKISYKDLIEGLKTGKRNFVWELWGLRKSCSENANLDQCNSYLLEMVETNKNYSAAEKEKLKELFNSYFNYESSIRESGIEKSGAEFAEKYEFLRKKRMEFFSEPDAELVFGMEESQVEFMKASSDFISDNKNLTGIEKVKKYESLKREKLGPYYDAMVKREDPYQNYQLELDLMQEDLNILSANEQNQKIRSILEKHFGSEEAERMMKEAALENEARLEREKKIAEYELKEKKFISENKDLSSYERERKLSELRIAVLGDDAENYIMKKNIDSMLIQQ